MVVAAVALECAVVVGVVVVSGMSVVAAVEEMWSAVTTQIKYAS